MTAEAKKMDRFQLLKVAEGGTSGMAGPTWRRVDCMVPGIGVEVWAVLVEYGGRYLLEDLCQEIRTGNNPPMFTGMGDAVGWLVDLINGSSIAGKARAALDKIAAEAAAKGEAQRAEELARAKAIVEAAEKRARESESV